jgi:ACR3 family arsenite efflux pump ArsB
MIYLLILVITAILSNGGFEMLQQVWDSFVLLIPVFFLLVMIFGAGFYIGRVSKRE